MNKERELIKQMIKSEILGDIGIYNIALVNDQSIIPYPSDTESNCIILYRYDQLEDSQETKVYKGPLTKGIHRYNMIM